MDAKSGLREAVLVNRLLVCMILLTVQTQTRPVLLGCEMTRFCYMIRSIIHYVHDHYFETPSVLSLYFDYILLNFLISSSVTNNSVCVRSNIVWNRLKSTLRPSSTSVSLNQGTKIHPKGSPPYRGGMVCVSQ